MKGLVSIVLILISLPLSSYHHEPIFDLENEKYLNFVSAIENQSTVSYFTVVKIKNLNTGQIKEICTKGNFVMGALHLEMNREYDTSSQRVVLEFAKSKKDRYFEFKSKKALQNMSFFEYNAKLVDKIKGEYNFGRAVDIIQRGKEFSVSLGQDKNKAFAHVMFNKGIIMAENNCFGGTLYYVDRITKNN